jgi:hypothetical protein
VLRELASRLPIVSLSRSVRDEGKLVVLIFSIGISACATVPKVDLDRQHAIKTVTMLKVVEPASQSVVNLGGAAGAFGLIGALAQNNLNEVHSKAYTVLVRQRNVTFASPFESDIAAQLRSAGFEVSSVDLRPVVQADGRTLDYAVIDVSGDAILHIWFTTLGYVSPPSKIAFQPWITVRVRLLDAKTKKDLYFKTFTCGYQPLADGIVHLNADPRFEYGAFDDLTSQVDQSISGLIACNRDIATQIAGDFARR